MTKTDEVSNTVLISDKNWADGVSIVNVHLDLINDHFNDPKNLGRRLGLFTTDKHLVDRRPWAVDWVQVKFVTSENGSPGVVLNYGLSPTAKFLLMIWCFPAVVWRTMKFLAYTLPCDVFRLLRRRWA